MKLDSFSPIEIGRKGLFIYLLLLAVFQGNEP